MIVQVKLPAAEHQRFAPGCFDSQIGGSFPFGGRPAVLQSYEVTGDGTAVLITVDVEDLGDDLYRTLVRRNDISPSGEFADGRLRSVDFYATEPDVEA